MSKVIVGIDPGLKGGIAVLIETSKGVSLFGAWKMPLLAGKLDKRKVISDILEASALADKKSNVTVCSERATPQPTNGAKSAFTSGANFAIFEIAAIVAELRYIDVHPTTWKKDMGLSDVKDDSIRLCQQLFPQFKIPKGTKHYHDGIAEAILLAEYARRKGY